MLNVEFKLKAHHDATLTVHNMLGKVVMRKPVSPDGIMHLNTSKLQDGIYFYTIQNQNRVAATRKFVVSH
ncbi:MAG: T9SS type A sorting domain-containing protein [Bacteroidales bacterium]|nr:T9SS type A sorting domain-containing protein [Bacteroidales bacterium]